MSDAVELQANTRRIQEADLVERRGPWFKARMPWYRQVKFVLPLGILLGAVLLVVPIVSIAGIQNALHVGDFIARMQQVSDAAGDRGWTDAHLDAMDDIWDEIAQLPAEQQEDIRAKLDGARLPTHMPVSSYRDGGEVAASESDDVSSANGDWLDGPLERPGPVQIPQRGVAVIAGSGYDPSTGAGLVRCVWPGEEATVQRLPSSMLPWGVEYRRIAAQCCVPGSGHEGCRRRPSVIGADSYSNERCVAGTSSEGHIELFSYQRVRRRAFPSPHLHRVSALPQHKKRKKRHCLSTTRKQHSCSAFPWPFLWRPR
jgi:hypothetical protein